MPGFRRKFAPSLAAEITLCNNERIQPMIEPSEYEETYNLSATSYGWY